MWGSNVNRFDMKKFMVIIAIISLAGCSSTSTKVDETKHAAEFKEAQHKNAEAIFQEANGSLTLTFDENGSWVKITTTASASFNDDSPLARDNGLMIAGMRAKRNLAEFINNGVKSTKAISNISRTYARNFRSSDGKDVNPIDADSKVNGSETDEQSNKFASTVTERISDTSTAILKGAYISKSVFATNEAMVELTVSRASIDAARDTRRQMSR